MANMFAVATTTAMPLVAATSKTVIQITAPTNQRVKVLGWGVFFDGASATAVPVRVRLLKQTSAGTMTPLTPLKTAPRSETVQSTAASNATVEPSSTDVQDFILCHPQQGYEVKFPEGSEIILGGGERLGIECLAPAIVNVVPKIFFEE